MFIHWSVMKKKPPAFPMFPCRKVAQLYDSAVLMCTCMQKREQEATELKLTKREIEEREEQRQEEMKRELQKAIKRKAEREKEKEARESEMVRWVYVYYNVFLVLV